jgi:hypothetical protein
MIKIHGNGIAPFRFLTPFHHRPPRRLRNSALKKCQLQPAVCTQPFFTKLILSCSNILGGRFHRLPLVDDIVAEKRCWGIQGDMSPWSQDEIRSLRRGGSEP